MKEKRAMDVRARSALRKCLLASSGVIRLLRSSSSGPVAVPSAAALARVRAIEGSSSLESPPCTRDQQYVLAVVGKRTSSRDDGKMSSVS